MSQNLKHMLYTEHGYEDFYDIDKRSMKPVNLAKKLTAESARLRRYARRYDEVLKQRGGKDTATLVRRRIFAYSLVLLSHQCGPEIFSPLFTLKSGLHRNK